MSADVIHLDDRRPSVAVEIVARETFPPTTPAGVDVEVTVFSDGAISLIQGGDAIGLSARQAYRLERLLVKLRAGAPR